MSAPLTGQTPAATYQQILRIDAAAGLDATPRAVTDGQGDDSALSLSTTQVVVTSTNAQGWSVGPNGTTNPALQADLSAASAVTGLKVTTKAAGAGLALVVTSTGTNEGLTLDTKGTGTLALNGTATGAVTVGAGGLQVTSAGVNALAVGPNGTTNPGLQVDDSTASAATGLKVTPKAAGAGVNLDVISSGANENLNLNPKGTGQLVLPVGSAAAPSYSFAGNLGVGMYVASNSVTFAVGGVQQVLFLFSSIFVADPYNFIVGTTTGTQFGTAAAQKIAFHGATPVVQHATTGTTGVTAAGTGTALKDDTTLTGGVGATAYTLADVIKALKNKGIMAA